MAINIGLKWNEYTFAIRTELSVKGGILSSNHQINIPQFFKIGKFKMLFQKL